MATKAPEDTATAASGGIKKAPTSENIQVFIRIRPPVDRELALQESTSSGSGPSIRAIDSQTIEVKTSDSTVKCSYDAVFDASFSQEQVYERVRECTQSFLQGFNSTLFAYGQTGSGKSFTMFGAETDLSRYRPGLQRSLAGIIPRAIKEIFASTVQMEVDAQPAVYCSFVQIYNEQIFDLLRDSNMDRPLEIHEDRKNGIFVEGLSEYAVRGVNDCLQLLQAGEQHRAVRSTHMNQVSSRSHSVFQLLLEQKRKSDGAILKSKFNLVDLAGSEKWHMGSDMMDHHISEMNSINLSLHTLGRCIAALSSRSGAGSHSHIPYRDSKLTRLLQDSLGGNTKTKIIATLSPSPDCVDESVSTLKFADRAKKVMVVVRVNEHRTVDPAYVEKLERELEQLREIVRVLRGPSSKCPASHDDDSNNSTDSHATESDEDDGSGDCDTDRIKARLVRITQENVALRRQTESYQKEIELLRKQLSRGQSSLGSAMAPDPQVLQAKTQLEDTLRQLKDASDRFFRFEIEEEELKTIHSRLFKGISGTLSTSSPFPRPPPASLKSAGSFSSSSGSSKIASGPLDMMYRVRARSTSAAPSCSASTKAGLDPSETQTWKNDAQNGKGPISMEKELEMSRKAIEKQQKLQNWLVEKERRELLKLQAEQQYIEEQRRQSAEKDAKFFRHAAATKRKLIMAAAASDSPKSAV